MYIAPNYHFVFSKSNCFNQNYSNEKKAWVSALAHSEHGPISFEMIRNLNYVHKLLLSCTPHALFNAWGVVNDI